MSESALMSCAEASDLAATAEEEEELVSGSEGDSGELPHKSRRAGGWLVELLMMLITSTFHGPGQPCAQQNEVVQLETVSLDHSSKPKRLGITCSNTRRAIF
jgi:hypothetical protein